MGPSPGTGPGVRPYLALLDAGFALHDSPDGRQDVHLPLDRRYLRTW